MKYKFHFWKFELDNGRWYTYFNLSEAKLQKKIKELNPKNVYVSVNQFLDYSEHNKSFAYQNKIIKRFGLIDIDGQNFGGFAETERYYQKIVNFLRSNKVEIKECVQTNSKVGGFQITIQPESYLKVIGLIHSREDLFRKIDFCVFDDKRVRRPAMVLWNGNKKCFTIPKDLNTPNLIYYRKVGYADPSAGKLSRIAKPATDEVAGINTLGMPLEADDNSVVKATLTTVQNNGEDTQIKSNGLHHQLQVTNSVYGTKGLYIPILKFIYSNSAIKRLIKLQKAYNLGDLHIMRHKEFHYAFGLKCVDKGLLMKVLRKHRVGYHFFIKYCLLWLPLGKLDGCLKMDSFGQYSRPHCNFFRMIYSNLSGKDKLPVYRAVVGVKG